MGILHIICNPQSGAGQGNVQLQHLLRALHQRHIAYQVHLTEYRQHATKLARTLAQPNEPILVIGGDGTLHEVIDGLYFCDTQPPVAYLPAGTGNDFSRAWQPNASVDTILTAILDNPTPTTVPLFKVTNHLAQEQHILLNNMGFGLDAAINVESKRLQKGKIFSNKWLYKLSYLAAIRRCLQQLELFDIDITVDGQHHTVQQCGLACVMNIPFIGGGIVLDRSVKATQQRIDVVAFHSITFASAIDLVWRVLFSHTQDQSPHMLQLKGQSVHIHIQSAVQHHIDGEDQGQQLANYTYELASYPFYLPHS